VVHKTGCDKIVQAALRCSFASESFHRTSYTKCAGKDRFKQCIEGFPGRSMDLLTEHQTEFGKYWNLDKCCFEWTFGCLWCGLWKCGST